MVLRRVILDLDQRCDAFAQARRAFRSAAGHHDVPTGAHALQRARYPEFVLAAMPTAEDQHEVIGITLHHRRDSEAGGFERTECGAEILNQRERGIEAGRRAKIRGRVDDQRALTGLRFVEDPRVERVEQRLQRTISHAGFLSRQTGTQRAEGCVFHAQSAKVKLCAAKGSRSLQRGG
jgi:hypothetical protein